VFIVFYFVIDSVRKLFDTPWCVHRHHFAESRSEIVTTFTRYRHPPRQAAHSAGKGFQTWSEQMAMKTEYQAFRMCHLALFSVRLSVTKLSDDLYEFNGIL